MTQTTSDTKLQIISGIFLKDNRFYAMSSLLLRQIFIYIAPIFILLASGNLEAAEKMGNDLEIIQLDRRVFFNLEGAKDTITNLITVNGRQESYFFQRGLSEITWIKAEKSGELLFTNFQGKYRLFHISGDHDGNYRIKPIPLWMSVIPPLLAILLALLFKEVILALFLGLFSGVFIAGGLRIDSIFHFIVQFFNTITDYLVPTLTNQDHMSVIIFTLLIGGMVGVISRNGGMAGVVNALSRYARNPVSTQIITWLMGIAIFFDDYANTLIVGNTMKSVSDKFRISREKLAYIVDSTAAPVAAVAFITTWIGAELGYIGDGIKSLEGFDPDITPYSLFLRSLNYAFYPLFTLLFVVVLILLKREYGPMYRAEINARSEYSGGIKSGAGEKDQDESHFFASDETPKRWVNAFLPIVILIMTTALGLTSTGMDKTALLLSENGQQLSNHGWGEIWRSIHFLTGTDGYIVNAGFVIGNADSFISLLWGSAAGLGLAVVLTISQRLLKVNETFLTMTNGFKSMVPALIILSLAWSLAKTTEQLHTAEFITSALDGILRPEFMPALVFIISGLIAFSTGSSWSTMAILFPIAIPASWALSMQTGLGTEASTELLIIVISTIMGASVMGDHASPISDTTIMSSMASGCDHVQHVRTQLPYALTVGTVAFIFTLISSFYWGNTLMHILYFVAGTIALYLIILKLGKKIPSMSEK